MRITNKMMVDNMVRHLARGMSRLDRYHEQLSTGRKFSLPSQDPAGAYFSMWLRSELQANDQMLNNVSNALGWLESTDQTLNQLGSMMQRARELMIYSASGVHDRSSAEAIAVELEQIREGMVELANNRYGDRYLFSGTKTQTPPYRVVEGNTILQAEYMEHEHGLKHLSAYNLLHGEYSVNLDRHSGDREAGIEMISATNPAILGALQEPITSDYNVSLNIEVAGLSRDVVIPGGLAAAAKTDDFEVRLELGEGDTEAVTVVEDGGDYVVRVTYTEGATAADIEALILGHSASPEEDYDAGELLNLKLLDGINFAEPFDGALPAAGPMDIKVSAHIYDLDANYIEHETQTFTVDMTAADFELDLADAQGNPMLSLTFDQDADWITGDLIEGDNIVYAITPTLADDTENDILELIHENGSVTTWTFTAESFDDQTTPLRFFGTDIDPESEDYRTIYDGELQTTFTKFGEVGEAARFTFGTGPFYRGDENDIKVRLAPGLEVAINLNGREVFGPFMDLLGDAINDLRDLDFLTISEKRLQAIDDVIDDFLSQRTRIGTQMLRMELTSNRLHSQEIDIQKNLEAVEGVDMAKTISLLMMEESIYRTALATGARIVQPTLMDFLR